MGIWSKIRNLTSMDIDKMSHSELSELVSKGSKLANQNMRRLKVSQYGKYSRLLDKNSGSFGITELKKTRTDKMTNTELRNKLTKLTYVANAKTGSIEGTKGYINEINEKTGIDITQLSSEDWREIRELLEEESIDYGSEDIIASYQQNLSKSDIRKRATQRYDERNDIDETGVTFDWVD